MDARKWLCRPLLTRIQPRSMIAKWFRRVRSRIANARRLLVDNGFHRPIVLGLSIGLAGIIISGFGFVPLSGDVTADRYWLSAAFQGIAALFALFISLTLIMAQLASQVYSHRLTQGFFRARWFWMNLVFGLFLLVYLLYLQTILSDALPRPTVLLWVALALSVFYLLLVPVVIRCALDAVRPRNLVVPILERIDEHLLSRMNRPYGDRSFAPLPHDDNPLVEIESMTTAFLRQGEVALATATFRSLIDTFARCAKSSHYAALCWHVGPSIRRIARVLITIHNDELLREFVRTLAELHCQTFNVEFAGNHGYADTSWPRVLLDIGRACVREGFPEGVKWCGLGINWMAETDCKHLPPESKNYRLRYILDIDAPGKALNPSEEEERIYTQYENFDTLFVHSMTRLAEGVGPAASIVIPEIVHSYRQLGFTIRDELKQEHVHTRRDALWSISYELRKLIVIAERVGALHALLEFEHICSLADFSLQDGDDVAATALLQVVCDALLRAAEGGVDCAELQMPIIELTCDGCLSGLARLPAGLDMVKISVHTLCRLADLMPEKYAGHGLGGEYDRVYDELGRRLLQIKQSPQSANPTAQEVLKNVDSALEEHWPRLSEKRVDPRPRKPI